MADATIVRIVHPVDLARPKVGGIHAFISAFVRFLPDDFAVEHLGLTGRDGPPAHRWSELEVEGRGIRVFPLLVEADVEHRARVPLGARYVAALWRAGGRLGSGAAVAQFHRPGVALPALRWPMARVQVVHLSADQLRSEGSESRWRRLGGGLRLVERRVLRGMDWIVVVNEQATDQYRYAFPHLADRIDFLSNFVDDTTFTSFADEDRRRARAELASEMGAAPDERLVLAVGRLEQQKRPLVALDVLHRLADDSVRLALVGDGSQRPEVERRIVGLGLADRVRILGPRDRPALARLLNGADALLISSAHETGPTVAFEALACGLPVASAPVGRVAALVGGGAAGSVATAFSADALADALVRVLRQPDPAAVRRAAIEAAAPYAARAVLGPFYDRHRRLAANARR